MGKDESGNFNRLGFMEIRLYQTPNLLEKLKGSAYIIPVTEPTNAQWNSVNNFIAEPSKGNSGTSEGPIIDAAGTLDTDQCWTFN